MAGNGQRVNWGDEPVPSQRRGRSRSRSRRNDDIPLSYFNPITYDGRTKPFWNVAPKDFVPTGKGNKDQQVGYWNRQQRYRMQKGQRFDLPDRWFFYYLGTGPHATAKFKDRIDGVFWVGKNGSKIVPTGLGTRGTNQQSLDLRFDCKVPTDFKLETNAGSRNNSRSRSRGRSKSNTRSNNSSGNNADIATAVAAALTQMGFAPKETQKNRSRSKSKGRSTSKERTAPNNENKHSWKKTPGKGDVESMFGKRRPDANFGNADLVALGSADKHYPQLAECVPGPAALLFGGKWTAKEEGDNVVVTVKYNYTLPNDDKTKAFLSQIDAYTKPSDVVKEQRSRSKSRERPQTPIPIAATAAEDYTDAFDENVEIIDELN
uniref:Nucleoprotein n=1 Tax=Ferret coronavirus TaxID=1264898 RepID=A0A0K2SFU5_9ALPC|nr:nucleocapsid protein [Ferret coronavirus]